MGGGPARDVIQIARGSVVWIEGPDRRQVPEACREIQPHDAPVRKGQFAGMDLGYGFHTGRRAELQGRLHRTLIGFQTPAQLLAALKDVP